MKNLRTLPVPAVCCALLLLAACQKDELTTVSTANTHTCGPHLVQLNIDSLLDCGGPPNQPDVAISLCSCDTLVLQTANYPNDMYFSHWTIDQGEENVYSDEPVLDTITVNSEIWIDIHNDSGPSEHLRIDVVVAPCE